MRLLLRAASVVCVLMAGSRWVAAQTVTATTGAINGTVSDSTKAVLPGVTVTLSGPAAMGAPTAVTDQNGVYRFSSVTPGDYALKFELSGFGTLNREGIHVNLGFTATVNVEMAPAGVAENLTVSGASPVVDVQATNITTNFESQKLANLPGSRDFWSTIIAQVPATAMTKLDVGGNNSMTVAAHTEYGTTGQGRTLLEGMVVTYLTTSELGIYVDYGSLADVAVTAVGGSAENPSPGILSQLVAKSGGNTYHGDIYVDYENDSMEAHNIDQGQIARGVTGGRQLAATELNRLQTFHDFNADVGGYVTKDKSWWYISTRYPLLKQRYPTLLDTAQQTTTPAVTTKATYSLSKNNKLIAYWTHDSKRQPDYLGSWLFGFGQTATAIQTTDTTWDERFPTGVWKGEYDSVVSNSAFVDVRGGYYYSTFDYAGKSQIPRTEDLATNIVTGGNYTVSNPLTRPQASGALSYFRADWFGEHSFKFGGEVIRELSTTTFIGPADNALSVFRNRQPAQVYLFQSPATASYGAWTYAAYANDTWKLRQRLTLNLGLRYDRYRSFLPAQQGPTGQNFAAVDDALTWNTWGPRVGVTYDLSGDGKTIAKFTFGQYWNNPLSSVASQISANTPYWYQLFSWSDRNGNGFFDPGEQGTLLFASGGVASTGVDPNLKDQFTRDILTYLEREVAPNLGVRTGFVWRGQRQTYKRVNVNQPFSGFTVPVTVRDPGPEGILGTADDGGTIQAFNLAPQYVGVLPLNVLQNVPNSESDYYTWEVTATKRATNSWSLLASFAKTWSNRSIGPVNPNDLINRDNGRDVFTTWQAKLHGTFELPAHLRLTPVIRHQSGTPFGRTFFPALNYGFPAILVEPIATQRTPNVTVFDIRSEKGFPISGRRVAVFADVYNIFNTNAEQQLVTSSGASWLRPLTITGPRIARVGAKVEW